MSAWTVFFGYIAALSLSLWLLWRFSHVRWYWHLASLMIAIGIAVVPYRESWNRPSVDLMIGAAILFLLLWGAGEFAFRWLHIHRHA